MAIDGKRLKRDTSFEVTVRTLFSSQHKGEALSIAAHDRKQTVCKMKRYITRIVNHAPPKQAAAFTRHWSTLPVLHVTGTKGKGSCCAFIESILRQHNKEYRTGLFTSPHLVRVTERFRINGIPCKEESFIACFWEVWDALHAGYESDLKEDPNNALEAVPGYFRLLTLVCLWLFAKESIEIAVIEVGCGGRYDATNIVGCEFEDWTLGKVFGCGITTLDYDHMETLGNTLTSIAYEKGGIFKSCAKLFTVPQVDEGMKSLHSCVPKGKALVVVDPDAVTCKLGLAGDFQKVNAALAIALCCALDIWSGISSSDCEQDIIRGLETASWPGRCQTLPLSTQVQLPNSQPSSIRKVRYHLDCAHTPLSVDAALTWFEQTTITSDGALRILVFNCSHEKDPLSLLQRLSKHNTFDCGIFCPASAGRPSRFKLPSSCELLQGTGLNLEGLKEPLFIHDAYADSDSSQSAIENTSSTNTSDSLEWQRTLADVWRALSAKQSSSGTAIAPNLKAALYWASNFGESPVGEARDIHVFITGSVYLVGGALELLSP